MIGLHHAFIDYQLVRYQEHHGSSLEYEGSEYGETASENDLMLPWGIPVRNVLDTRADVCVEYVPQDYSIVVPGVPDDGSIKEPGSAENWLNSQDLDDEVSVFIIV